MCAKLTITKKAAEFLTRVRDGKKVETSEFNHSARAMLANFITFDRPDGVYDGYYRLTPSGEAVLCEWERLEQAKRDKRNAVAKAKREAMSSLGLKRVRGNLGGSYCE